MKIIITSSHCTKTELIEFQYKTIKKYILDADYEYYVFNDGITYKSMCNFNNDQIYKEIQNKCEELNIPCIDIPQDLHNNRNLIFKNTEHISSQHPCSRCAIVTQYMYNYVKNTECILVIIESDMFFINYINLENFIGISPIKYLEQSRRNEQYKINYMWVGILMINTMVLEEKELINFDCGSINGISLDTGGYTYYYLLKYGSKIKNFYVQQKILNGFDSLNKEKYTKEFVNLCENINDFYYGEGIFGEIYLNDSLFHIRSFGSNWNYSSKFFYKFLEENNVKSDIGWDEKPVYWKLYMNKLSMIFKNYINNI